MPIHSRRALTCETGRSRTPRFRGGLRRFVRAATLAPRPPPPHTLPGTACSTHTKNPEAHAVCPSIPASPGRLVPPGVQGALRKEWRKRHHWPAVPEGSQTRNWTAVGLPPQKPLHARLPLKPNRSHLYAQHRCRRRSQRGPPYPPLPRSSAAASAGGGSATVFTARNQ